MPEKHTLCAAVMASSGTGFAAGVKTQRKTILPGTSLGDASTE
jgi:hypothetical protein